MLRWLRDGDKGMPLVLIFRTLGSWARLRLLPDLMWFLVLADYE